MIVLVVHMIAHFTILFVLIVLGKIVQTPQVLCTKDGTTVICKEV